MKTKMKIRIYFKNYYPGKVKNKALQYNNFIEGLKA